MSRGDGAYGGAVKTFYVAFHAVGVLLLGVTHAKGGGPASMGVLLGVVFVAVGALRLWLAMRIGK